MSDDSKNANAAEPGEIGPTGRHSEPVAIRPDLPRVSPSELLGDSPPEPSRRRMAEPVVALSPTELLPSHPVPRRALPWKPIGAGVAGVVALALAALAWQSVGKSVPQLTREATADLEAGRIDEAAVRLKDVVELEPANPQPRLLLARTRLVRGDAKGAEAELRRALELGATRGDVVVLLGRALLMQRRFQDVLDEIPPEAVEQASVAAAVGTVRGLAHLGLGNVAEARRFFDAALTKTPEFSEALIGLARIELRERRPQSALALLDRAVSSDARNRDGWQLKGDVHVLQKQFEQGRGAYEQVLQIDPRNPVAHLALAGLDIEAGKLAPALAHLGPALRGMPRNPKALYFRALIAYRQNHLAEARQAIMAASQVAPNELSVQILAAVISYADRSYADAEFILMRMLDKHPTFGHGRKLLGASMLKTGQSRTALGVLQPTLQLLPNDAGLLALLGRAHFQVGDVGKAQELLERALSVGSRAATARDEAERPAAERDIDKALAGDVSTRATRALIAELQMQRGRYDDALRMIATLEAEAAQPELDLVNLKGTVLAAKKDYAGARKAFETAVSLAWYHVPSAMSLALIDIAEGDPLNARRRLLRIVDRQPGNVEALVGLASLGPSIGAKPEEIGAWLEQAAASEKQDGIQGLLMLGRSMLQQGNAERALAAAQQAQAKAKEDPRALRLLGAAQMALGRASDAVGTYTLLATAIPDSADVLNLLAAAHLANNNNAAAALLLRKSLGMVPDAPAALLALGEVELRAGRPASALALARKVQKLTPDVPAPYILEGDAAMAEGRADAAAQAYEQAYARRRSSEVIVRAHDALYRGGRQGDAANLVQTWVAENPRDISFRAYYGAFLLKQERYAEARAEFEAVVRIQPQQPDALNNLAWLLHRSSDRRAREFAERAARARPNDPAILDTLGVILVDTGEVQAGIDALERALSIAPGIPDVHLHLAQAWLKAGNRAAARRELERLLVAAPQSPEAARARVLLSDLQR